MQRERTLRRLPLNALNAQLASKPGASQPTSEHRIHGVFTTSACDRPSRVISLPCIRSNKVCSVGAYSTGSFGVPRPDLGEKAAQAGFTLHSRMSNWGQASQQAYGQQGQAATAIQYGAQHQQPQVTRHTLKAALVGVIAYSTPENSHFGTQN